jgi:hypothetical protein
MPNIGSSRSVRLGETFKVLARKPLNQAETDATMANKKRDGDRMRQQPIAVQRSVTPVANELIGSEALSATSVEFGNRYAIVPQVHSFIRTRQSTRQISQRYELVEQLQHNQGNQFVQRAVVPQESTGGESVPPQAFLLSDEAVQALGLGKSRANVELEARRAGLELDEYIKQQIGVQERFVIPGWEVEVERLVNALQKAADRHYKAHTRYLKEIYTPVIADICTGGFLAAGTVEVPDPEMWMDVSIHLEGAREGLSEHRFRDAVWNLKPAAEIYGQCHRTWHGYLEATHAGGDTAVTQLIIIIGVCASVGAWAAPQVVLSTGAGFLKKSAVTAIAGMTYQILFQSAREASEYIQGVDPEFNWRRFFANVIVEGLSGFVGEMLSGALQPIFSRLFPIKIGTQETLEIINKRLVELEIKPLSYGLFIGELERQSVKVLVAVPADLISNALEVTIEGMATHPPKSWEEFMDAFTTELVEEGGSILIENIIQILSGG